MAGRDKKVQAELVDLGVLQADKGSGKFTQKRTTHLGRKRFVVLDRRPLEKLLGSDDEGEEAA